jgi:beta-1,4-mannooligosaccharide phosphorylase
LDLGAVLDSHFQFVARGAHELSDLSKERQLLIGAYHTQEFSIETAALTNPSIVAHPDQDGLDPGSLRFVLSLRAIGEGHLSSIEFRSGVIDATGSVTVEPPSRYAVTGTHRPSVFDKATFCEELQEMDACDSTAKQITDQLSDPFEMDELDAAIASVEGKRSPCHLTEMATKAMHWLATSNYQVSFNPESKLSERVIFPWSVIESHGLEDARFVRFEEDDGSITYYATYAAYDGIRVLPQLISTVDFATFNIRIWNTADRIGSPTLPWELATAGNCGSPLENEAGWLLITHGVGPFREYSLSALLLDIDDPSRVIGRLDQPLLTATGTDREGYVPNVVYSCGSMIHGDDLLLPHGLTDTTTRIAQVPLQPLLDRLLG